MKIRYTNPNALTHDVQVPVIQSEPIEYQGEYEVSKNVAAKLLGTGFWEIVDAPLPKTEEGSDLRRVRGIGKQTANALFGKGIDSIHALIKKTPEEIDEMLDGSLNYVTVDMIAGWQANARQLMEE